PRRLRQQAARATDAGRPWDARLPIEVRAAFFRLRKAASKSPADAGIPAVGQAVALNVDEVPSKKKGTAEKGRGAGHSVPSPLVGEGQGGGDPQTSKVKVPPTPNFSPQGGGESGRGHCEGAG